MISNLHKIALAACAELAESRNPATVRAIAGKLGVSESYIEQIFARLKAAKIIKAVRGPGGGYSLADKPRRISVLDIVAALSGTGQSLAGSHPANVLLLNLIESVIAEIGLYDLIVPTATEAA